MTRDEHLKWAKRRAIECLPDVQEAMASMISDLNKHDELREQHRMTNQLGLAQLSSGALNTPAAMRHWIEGYN